MKIVNMPKLFLCVLILFVSSNTCFSIRANTITPGQVLDNTNSIVSDGNIFELGFFSKGANSSNTYLGIWYKNLPVQTTVWVANREESVSQPSTATFEFAEDGNLILAEVSSRNPIWTTNISSAISKSPEAVLLDDGNFVLRNSLNTSTIYWQSFDHPTDTLLPGAKIGINKISGKTTWLTSWKNSADPAPGKYSIQLNGTLVLVWDMNIIYSKVKNFSMLNYAYNFSFVTNERESYLTYSLSNKSTLSRLIIDQSGQMKILESRDFRDWNLLWAQPRSINEVYGFCGAFGILNEQTSTCECLHGFIPVSTLEPGLNDWSQGCVRRTALLCQNTTTENSDNGYTKISDVVLPDNFTTLLFSNVRLCEAACNLDCSCVAFASHESVCSRWEGNLMNLRLANGNNNGQDLYLKVAPSELQTDEGPRTRWLVIGIAVPLTLIVVGLSLWQLRKRKIKRKGAKSSGEDLQLFDFDGSSDSKKKKDFELPFFSFASVSAATGGFASDNKLGEGGFGPVYQGKILRGQEIAVKRLSKRSGQGVEEFRNESVLIAKLQHRNLVRLLGSCIDQDENMLIYEYMPNKSLDFFLFDQKRREILDWKSRIHIIEGISQGLLYLHLYSRLRIIHRDLKASNILLDSEMNPKISDFGMARMFGSNESHANTQRIVGTYGYMAPEYAMEGRFSIKSDVFSFGVLLLEIISGKRNTGFYHSNSLNLLTYAWDLWIADRGLELLDETLIYPLSGLVLRYINIGLLCVEEHPDDRPTMSEVVSMLSNELIPLQPPKKPAFSARRTVTNTNSTSSISENCSVNGVTISEVEAR